VTEEGCHVQSADSLGLNQKDGVAVFLAKDLDEHGWTVKNVATGVLDMKGCPLEYALKCRRLLWLDGSAFWNFLDFALEKSGEISL
jgi:hypothetical protein